MIQTSAVITVGSGGPFNQIGAWAVIVPTVEVTSTWSAYYMSPFNDPGGVGTTVNLDLGIGDPGSEVRKFRSHANFGGGNSLEFDDSYWSNYLPFTFRAGQTISARIAGTGSVPLNVVLQLQLHS
jgi:hypothetical protein